MAEESFNIRDAMMMLYTAVDELDVQDSPLFAVFFAVLNYYFALCVYSLGKKYDTRLQNY